MYKVILHTLVVSRFFIIIDHVRFLECMLMDCISEGLVRNLTLFHLVVMLVDDIGSGDDIEGRVCISIMSTAIIAWGAHQ